MVWERPELIHLVYLPRFEIETPGIMQKTFDDLAIDYLYNGLHIGICLADKKSNGVVVSS